MSKSAVYSWRVAPETKYALEEEAHRLGESLSHLLDRIAREWLEARRRRASNDESEQARIRAAAMKAIGKIAGDRTRRAERARALIRERLERRRAS
jgi:hypothetical protein